MFLENGVHRNYYVCALEYIIFVVFMCMYIVWKTILQAWLGKISKLWVFR